MLKDYESTAKAKKVGIHSEVDDSKYTKENTTKGKFKKITKKHLKKVTKKLSASIYDFISEILDEFF